MAVDEITKLAKTLRAAYVQARSAFESVKLGTPYKYHVPKSYDGKPPIETTDGVVLQPGTKSVWIELAKFVRREDVDPLLFIEAQFDRGPTQRAVEPRQLKSAKCLTKARRLTNFKGQEVATELFLQQDTARGKITSLQIYGKLQKEDSYAVTLLDTDLELSPLFRYCLALSIGGLRFRRIAKRFEVEACVQYRRYRTHYKRHWSELLPAGFDRLSRQVNRQVMSQDEGDGKDHSEEDEEI